MNVQWAGQNWRALGERALYWEERATLILSDLHLGKAGDFQAAGIPVPSSIHFEDLARLERLVQALAPARVLILGDFVHSNELMHLDLAERFVGMRAGAEWILALGNHDRRTASRLSIWQFDQIVSEVVSDGILFSHHGAEVGFCVQGHVHPVVRVGRRRERLRLPCFSFGPQRLLLPSFGEFTGGFEISPAPGDRVLVVGDGEVFEAQNIAAR